MGVVKSGTFIWLRGRGGEQKVCGWWVKRLFIENCLKFNRVVQNVFTNWNRNDIVPLKMKSTGENSVSIWICILITVLQSRFICNYFQVKFHLPEGGIPWHYYILSTHIWYCWHLNILSLLVWYLVFSFWAWNWKSGKFIAIQEPLILLTSGVPRQLRYPIIWFVKNICPFPQKHEGQILAKSSINTWNKNVWSGCQNLIW